MKYWLGRPYLLKLKNMLEELKRDATVEKVPDWISKIDAVIDIIMELV